MDESDWIDLKGLHPVGSEIAGKVDRVMPFGLFVSVEGVPDGVFEVDGISIGASGWPRPGDYVRVVVVEQSDHNQELKSVIESFSSSL
ncbi:hypothetical protein [Streptomyces californicus]|uniref:hypothetical protein n=1 Tax=Streptomyces californicus TaxID=67351 RepID=UPI0037B8A704